MGADARRRLGSRTFSPLSLLHLSRPCGSDRILSPSAPPLEPHPTFHHTRRSLTGLLGRNTVPSMSRPATQTLSEPPELLSPAGDWECLRAAVANGADAVYFGLPEFNARLRAHNFTQADLPEVMDFLHRHGVKGYVTLNVLIFTGELTAASELLQTLAASGVDAVIIQDVGLAWAAHRWFPELRVHASTQMSITSPEGARFAAGLGVQQVVLARELSLRELAKFPPEVPLEVFVHGALCVAYSGQCLTSEALGQRSANRGECAQACRLPYELVVDGQTTDLGDRKYLLSPQDLAGVADLPGLLEVGIRSLKIEGRLKSPEYVAAVTAVYRRALDQAWEKHRLPQAAPRLDIPAEDWYQLEMTFSRGLYSGWLHGVNHQELVPARFGKKRGPLAGKITRVGPDWVEIDGRLPLRPGDGVVFDTGGDTDQEQGGRLYAVQGRRLQFQRGKIRFRELRPGHRVWKTDDPQLNKGLQRTWSGHLTGRPHRKAILDWRVSGQLASPLTLTATCGPHSVTVTSTQPLAAAHGSGLEPTRLSASLAKLEETPFGCGRVECAIPPGLHLPWSEINRLRRAAVEQLLALQRQPPTSTSRPDWTTGVTELLPPAADSVPVETPAQLTVLCRTEEQAAAAARFAPSALYLDFEDIRRYAPAVARLRSAGAPPLFLATPRIQKAGEEGFFKLIERAEPDGVLLRNIGGLEHFADSPLRRIGDFSLNVANPLSAALFLRHGLERVTLSYDLTVEQILPLIAHLPAHRLELTIHQHIPMFHMEHCVFAAFLSNGKDYTDCGRPCEKHRVHLRDRVGLEHPLRADVGCRNTLYQRTAQTGASFFSALHDAGLRHFRVELLEESAAETETILTTYQNLLDGTLSGPAVWQNLRARNQLGVTSGTLLGKSG
jgi:putative protease